MLGPNSGAVKLLAPDGFAQQSTIDLAGSASKGMFASVPGLVPQELKGPGKQLVSELKKTVEGPVELYAPYAGQAAELVLGALSGASGSRAAVISGVAHAKVKNGITGSFDILPSGDPSIGPITISRAGSTFVPSKVIKPSATLVAAARKGCRTHRTPPVSDRRREVDDFDRQIARDPHVVPVASDEHLFSPLAVAAIQRSLSLIAMPPVCAAARSRAHSSSVAAA